MVKIYGMPSCPDCAFVHGQIEGRTEEFEFINIGEHVSNLKEFMRIRDTNPLFDSKKAEGKLGIPCFVKADGSVTHDPHEVGLLGKDDEPVAGCGPEGC